ncbi:MAG: hypothetical protein WC182_04410 [Bacilli bacterium]
MTFLYLLCSMFLSITSQKFIVIEDHYPDEVVLETAGPYRLIKDVDGICLWHDDNQLAEYEVNWSVCMVLEDQLLIICVCDSSQVMITTYEEGSIQDACVLAEGTYQSAWLQVDNESIYVYGGVTNFLSASYPVLMQPNRALIDAYVVKLDWNLTPVCGLILGGFLDEWFTGLLVVRDCLFLSGCKETLTGGDLGNAGGEDGAHFLISCSWDQGLIHSLYFDQDVIASFTITDEMGIIVTDCAIYRINAVLAIEYAFKFDLDCRFATLMSNFTSLVITPTQAIFYSVMTGGEVGRVPLTLENGLISHYHNKIMIENETGFHEYRPFDCRDFDEEITYQDINQQLIYGMDEVLQVEDVHYMIPYQATIWGIYPVMYDFRDMNIEGSILVGLSTNVIEGRIYPLGYQLEFTGVGWLDDEVVVNHHMLTTTGSHTLCLQSINGEKRVISFVVDSQQVNGTDHYMEDIDLVGEVGKPFYLLLDVSVDPCVELKQIIVNQEVASFIQDGQRIEIKCEEEEAGYYEYTIEKVMFSSEGLKWEEQVGLTYQVCIRPSAIDVLTEFAFGMNEISCDVRVIDPNIRLRGILLTLYSDMEVRTQLFATKDQILSLSNLTPGYPIHVDVALAYDDGTDELAQVRLMRLLLNPTGPTCSIGQVLILQRGASLEKMAFIFSKGSLISEIKAGEMSVYQYQPPQYGWHIVIGLLLGVGSFVGIGVGFRHHCFSLKRGPLFGKRRT